MAATQMLFNFVQTASSRDNCVHARVYKLQVYSLFAYKCSEMLLSRQIEQKCEFSMHTIRAEEEASERERQAYLDAPNFCLN